MKHPVLSLAMKTAYANTAKYLGIILSVSAILLFTVAAQTCATAVYRSYNDDIKYDYTLRTSNGAFSPRSRYRSPIIASVTAIFQCFPQQASFPLVLPVPPIMYLSCVTRKCPKHRTMCIGTSTHRRVRLPSDLKNQSRVRAIRVFGRREAL